MTLLIDVENPYGPEVRIADHHFDGQWVEFYGLLALLRTDPLRCEEFIDSERLHAMAQWGTKRPESVGKEVSRHCKRLEQQGLEIIEVMGKTKLWRLRLPAGDIELRPSRASVGRWVSSHTRKLALDEQWVGQLEVLLAAKIALHTGEGESARETMREVSALASPDLDAWAGLIDARGTDAYIDARDNPHALDELAEYWAKSGHAAGRSVAARIRAKIGLRKRILEPDVQYAELEKVAAELERGGDIGGLGAVLNVLGVLATRTSRPEEAAQHHLRAAALFGIVSDYNSLQGAIFNIANARVRVRQLAGERPDQLCFRLLDSSLEVCRAFSVGLDSVQTEIAGVHWGLDAGDY
ncbi:MAG: hypothetical protein KC431_31200, partial [Myxococcales bacterium]|nr:hypothetical protein [Myxococcales bacterium]